MELEQIDINDFINKHWQSTKNEIQDAIMELSLENLEEILTNPDPGFIQLEVVQNIKEIVQQFSVPFEIYLITTMTDNVYRTEWGFPESDKIIRFNVHWRSPMELLRRFDHINNTINNLFPQWEGGAEDNETRWEGGDPQEAGGVNWRIPVRD